MVCTDQGTELLEGDGVGVLLEGDGEEELLEEDGVEELLEGDEEVGLVVERVAGEPLVEAEGSWFCSVIGRSKDNLCTATISSVSGLILYSDVFSFLFLFLYQTLTVLTNPLSSGKVSTTLAKR